MTFVTLIGVFILVAVVVVFVLSARGTGDGSDLLDWDATERVRDRRNADVEELELGLVEHNRRREAAGLAPQTEDELRQALARARRQASS